MEHEHCQLYLTAYRNRRRVAEGLGELAVGVVQTGHEQLLHLDPDTYNHERTVMARSGGTMWSWDALLQSACQAGGDVVQADRCHRALRRR